MEMAEQALRETDWARLDAMTDEENERNIASDPDSPPLMTGAMMAAGAVRVIRQRLVITQAEFSARYRMPIGTLRDWEQNRKQPDSTAISYLRVISKEPEVVAKALAA
jgi:putative transcriptional regulator